MISRHFPTATARWLGYLVLVATPTLVAPKCEVSTLPPPPETMRDVLLVGNSVAGTVSILDGRTFENLGSVNVLPDLEERLAEIAADPIWAIAYDTIKQKQIIKHFEPANGDRFVDDLFVSLDGTKLYVSRSNLGDVAAFDMTTSAHPMLWRTRVEGFKADHATISPDGSRLIVSATSVNKVDVFDALNGTMVGSFAAGTFPHQNDYSPDGKRIYNSSIGDVSLPYSLSALKGARQITVVDANTLQVLETYAFSDGIRPSVITPDEKTMFAQLSYFNGVIQFDLDTGTIVKRLEQPLSAFATATYPTFDDYPHDSAHHGLSMSGDGSKLCDLGTIDNTVTIVRTSDLSVTSTLDVGLIPYWATTSVDGGYCFVSLSGDNAISIIDFNTGQVVTTVPVGTFPQRSRLGRIREVDVATLAPEPG